MDVLWCAERGRLWPRVLRLVVAVFLPAADPLRGVGVVTGGGVVWSAPVNVPLSGGQERGLNSYVNL